MGWTGAGKTAGLYETWMEFIKRDDIIASIRERWIEEWNWRDAK